MFPKVNSRSFAKLSKQDVALRMIFLFLELFKCHFQTFSMALNNFRKFSDFFCKLDQKYQLFQTATWVVHQGLVEQTS